MSIAELEVPSARTLANRENAKKSTGPKTAEGKARSRGNAFKHGLAGQGVVWPGEEAGAMEAFVAEQVELDRPQDAREAWLARRAAVSAWQVERGESMEALNAQILAANGVDAELARRADEVERLVALLPESPARAVRHLLRTAEGCEWILAALWELAEAVDSDRPVLDAARVDALCRPPQPGLLAPSRAGRLAYAIVLGEADPSAHAELATHLLRRISEVETLLSAHRDRPDPALEHAALAASFDQSPAGERLRRYHRANLRQREKCLAELDAWRETRESRESLPLQTDLIPPPVPQPELPASEKVATISGAAHWLRSATQAEPHRPTLETPDIPGPTGLDTTPGPMKTGREARSCGPVL